MLPRQMQKMLSAVAEKQKNVKKDDVNYGEKGGGEGLHKANMNDNDDNAIPAGEMSRLQELQKQRKHLELRKLQVIFYINSYVCAYIYIFSFSFFVY